MRARFLGVAALWAFGCAAPAADGTPCDRAREQLGACGVMLPLLESDRCTGFAEQVASCVTRAGDSCDALARATAAVNACLGADDGGPIPPYPTDFPNIVAPEAGAGDDAGAADGARE